MIWFGNEMKKKNIGEDTAAKHLFQSGMDETTHDWKLKPENGFFVGFCTKNIGVVMIWLVCFTQAIESKQGKNANVGTNFP